MRISDWSQTCALPILVDPHRFQRALNGGVRAQNVPSAVPVRPKISGDFNVKHTCSFIAPAIRGSGSLVRTPEVADQPEAIRTHCSEMLWKPCARPFVTKTHAFHNTPHLLRREAAHRQE